MQGFISHSVYSVEFFTPIYGSLFIKSRLPIAHTREGARVYTLLYIECKKYKLAEHINTAARVTSTLLGKPYIRVRQRGCDDDTTPLNRRSNSCLRSPHRKQPKASVYAGYPSAEHLNKDREGYRTPY